MAITSIAVFCGSQSGTNEIYKQDAEALGKILAEQHVQMIYGGGKNGLMGYVADAVLKHGGTVRGIIPQKLMDRERNHKGISELIVVETMHERKRRMYELCDAAVILPGGFGTLDELFEILTWNQLSLHDKTIFLINSGGFYDHLLQHLQWLTNQGFLYGDLNEKMTVLKSASEFSKYVSVQKPML